MSTKKPIPLWAQLLVDLGVLGLALCLFSYFHHIRFLWNIGISAPPEPSVVITKPTAPSTTVDPAATSDTSATAPPYDTSGQFGEKFGHLFAQENTLISTETTYTSHDIHMTLKEEEVTFGSRKVHYFVYDIYVRNIENLFSEASLTQRRLFTDMISDKNILAAISGDYCGNGYASKEVIRNGVELRSSDTLRFDACVLYWDGQMEVLTPEEYDREAILAKAPYQLWNFGPSLLQPDGSPILDFSHRTDIGGSNPRSVIGYYEPGHYCLVLVDGRSEESAGVNLTNLAKLMSGLGCKLAYNLDGGASVHGYFNGRLLRNSDPGKEQPRPIYDIICVGEV